MELVHDFTVPAGRDQTWAAFSDIEGVAGCFPGATVTGVEADTFEGSVKVKLGPIALVYNGAGTITEKDEAAGRLLITAKGKDKRGNGTASAEVTVTMAGAAEDHTSVHVVTALQITGKPAQFGRSVMQDVSDKLLDQFTACLSEKLGEQPGRTEEPAAQVAGGGVVGSEAPQATDSAASPMDDLPDRGASPPPRPQPSLQRPDNAIDLGRTVLPVLVRSYGRQVLAVVALLLLVRWLSKRRG